MAALELIPATRAQANELVRRWHRHSHEVASHRFAVIALAAGVPVGAAIVGIPTGRGFYAPTVAEITRVVTDGTPNACSFLYGACGRIWRAMGGRRLYTYTTPPETGASLRAAGFRIDAVLEPRRGWDAGTRTRPGAALSSPRRLRWRRDL